MNIKTYFYRADGVIKACSVSDDEILIVIEDISELEYDFTDLVEAACLGFGNLGWNSKPLPKEFKPDGEPVALFCKDYILINQGKLTDSEKELFGLIPMILPF